MDSFEAFKKVLLQKKNELEKRMHRSDDDLHRRNKPLDKDFAEQAVEREGDEVLDALVQSNRAEILKINRALERLESGIYTVCATCQEDIPLNRLKAVPYTDLCIDCAERKE